MSFKQGLFLIHEVNIFQYLHWNKQKPFLHILRSTKTMSVQKYRIFFVLFTALPAF